MVVALLQLQSKLNIQKSRILNGKYTPNSIIQLTMQIWQPFGFVHTLALVCKYFTYIYGNILILLKPIHLQKDYFNLPSWIICEKEILGHYLNFLINYISHVLGTTYGVLLYFPKQLSILGSLFFFFPRKGKRSWFIIIKVKYTYGGLALSKTWTPTQVLAHSTSLVRVRRK